MARLNEVFPQAVLLTMRVSIQALVTAARTHTRTNTRPYMLRALATQLIWEVAYKEGAI